MVSLCAALLVAAPLAPLAEEDVWRAVQALVEMKDSARGPYQGVMWFCADGAVLPPKSYACRKHGGGLQYGVLGPKAVWLAEQGIHVGTVLAALGPEALAVDDYDRARALVIERYLERALDGWVLREARSYRGFRQDEDEEAAARRLLIELMRAPALYAQRRHLALRLVRALPYGRSGNLAAEIRALAGTLGDQDPRFANLRFKIHAMPEPSDADAVLRYAARASEEMAAQARALADKLRQHYDPAARRARLRDVRGWLRDASIRAAVDAFTATTDTAGSIAAGAALMRTAESIVAPGDSAVQGERNLLALHVIALVEEMWIGLTADLSRQAWTRRQALALLDQLLEGASLTGALSARELAALRPVVEAMGSGQRADWLAGVGRLRRVLEWGHARALADFGRPLGRYVQVEPRAAALTDDLLRSGVMLPLAALLDRLAADAQALAGGGHRLLELPASAAARGENAGLAVGPLRVVGAGQPLAGLARHEIVLLEELPPELPPVAGILTTGPVGSLSHVALLARNLGIPHAAIGPELAAGVAALEGREVVLGVSVGGRVLLGAEAALTEQERRLVARPQRGGSAPLRLETARLDLTSDRLLRLGEVDERDSGVRVGPKAGELGRLKRLFPERVADAVVIPFGLFVRHVDREPEPGQLSPLGRLRRAYAIARRLEEERATPYLLAELARLRQAIAELPFPDGFAAAVEAALAELGGGAPPCVFVRSDTNVEDLKDFTGAGLNLTVPNQCGGDAVLAAIRRVWASPFSERSFHWRQRLLANPEHVYPSVILHRSVASEISGVMVTADLETGDATALTVSASEGVAAVVDGGAPETIVLAADGGARLLASARSGTQKLLAPPPAGGLVLVAAAGRDPLLDEPALTELRALADEIRRRAPPAAGAPWDIEFGLVGGEAHLFQLRPLRAARAPATHPLLVALGEDAPAADAAVDLDGPLP